MAYLLRSPVAHGTITALDVEAARGMPGVALVADGRGSRRRRALTKSMPGTRVKTLDGGKGAGPRRPILAETRVRHVGEPVALVVAATLAEAKDAAEAITLEIDDLPPHLELAPGGEALHDEAPDNVAFQYGLGDRDKVQAAIDAAAKVVTVEVPDHRIIVNPMEPRGAYAEVVDGRLHVCINGQGVWAFKSELARMFDLEPEQIAGHQPRYRRRLWHEGDAAIPRSISSPTPRGRSAGRSSWMSDRTEAMLSDNAGRDLVSTATLAFDDANRLTGYKVKSVSNLGAYNSNFAQAIQTDLFSKVMPGTYDIPCAWLEVTGVYTNTAPVDAYRGAGRPEAIFVLERSMDVAARELGVDPLRAAADQLHPARAVSLSLGDRRDLRRRRIRAGARPRRARKPT